MSSDHERFMRVCLELARKGLGHVSPNPMVGAVLVKGGRILASGYHRAFGAAHAEVDCISSYRGSVKGATLYVNLEPCRHVGKTPPCTNLIQNSGIRSVVVGMSDPNPLMKGRGIAQMRRSGIHVVTDVLAEECRELNRWFVRHIVSRTPYIHMKVAQTLDGVIGTGTRSRLVISSPSSQRLTHAWRATHDAILVGAGTILTDDPYLTVRYAKGRNPHVIILDGRLTSPLRSRVFQQPGKRQVIVCASSSAIKRNGRHVNRLVSLGVMVLPFPESNGVLSLRDVLKRLYELNIGTILVEGGSSVFTQMLSQGLVDELSVFVAPLLAGEGVRAVRGDWLKHRRPTVHVNLKPHSSRCVGRDILLQFRR